MLVLLFCIGRRGHLASCLCPCFLRRRTETRSDDRPTVELAPVVVKTRLVSEVDIDHADEDAPVCTICLNAFVVGDVVAALDCPHLYHEHCIVAWLR